MHRGRNSSVSICGVYQELMDAERLRLLGRRAKKSSQTVMFIPNLEEHHSRGE